MSREDKNIEVSGSEAAAKEKKEKFIGSVKFFKRLITCLVILLIIALIAVIVYLLFRGEDELVENDFGMRQVIDLPGIDRGIIATPENIEEIIRRMSEPVEDGYYIARMNIDWVFETWDTPSGNAFIENVVENKRTVYFDLTLEDTNRLIYSSPFIPLGARLEGFPLDSYVPAGEHSAIVTYHLVDEEFRNLTTVSVAVQLNILG